MSEPPLLRDPWFWVGVLLGMILLAVGLGLAVVLTAP